jgi:hypothetical protein
MAAIGRYSQYKQATSVFLDWLKDAVPSVKSLTSTASILQAATYVVDKPIAVSSNIMSSLITSIDLRRETSLKFQSMTKNKSDGMLKSHEYFKNLLATIKDSFSPS